jgi:hypothetical protein
VLAINDFRDGWGEREIKTTKIQYGGEMFLEMIIIIIIITIFSQGIHSQK